MTTAGRHAEYLTVPDSQLRPEGLHDDNIGPSTCNVPHPTRHLQSTSFTSIKYISPTIMILIAVDPASAASRLPDEPRPDHDSQSVCDPCIPNTYAHPTLLFSKNEHFNVSVHEYPSLGDQDNGIQKLRISHTARPHQQLRIHATP